MAVKSKKDEPKKIRKNIVIDDSVYSRIIVNKTKRAGISLLFTIMTFTVSSFLYANLIFEIHWGVYALPTILLCSIVLVAPISEDWDYKPWQRFPQQVEHHYFD